MAISQLLFGRAPQLCTENKDSQIEPMTCVVPYCMTLSIMVGIPSFRLLPSGFGITARLTGWGILPLTIYFLILSQFLRIYPSNSYSSMPSAPPALYWRKPFCMLRSYFICPVSFPTALTYFMYFPPFPLPVISPMLRIYSSYTFRLPPLVRYSQVHTFFTQLHRSALRSAVSAPLACCASADFSQFVMADETVCETTLDKPVFFPRLYLTVQTFGVAVKFVDSYA